MAQTQISDYQDESATDADRFNTGNSQAEITGSPRTNLATALSDSDNGITANVVSYTLGYLKVKWLKGGLKFGGFKSRKPNQDRALTSLEFLKTKKLDSSAPSSLAVTGTNTISGTGTSQFTATLTRADSTTSDVSAKATWTSGTPAHATVSSSGLVTGVAAGTSVITASYAGKSNTRTVTVS